MNSRLKPGGVHARRPRHRGPLHRHVADVDVRPAHVADGEDEDRADDDAPLHGFDPVGAPHRQQVRVDPPDRLVARRPSAHRPQGADEDPHHADEHDDRLHEVRVGHGQVAAEERVEDDDADGDEQRPGVGDPGDHLEAATAGDELAHDVEEDAEHAPPGPRSRGSTSTGTGARGIRSTSASPESGTACASAGRGSTELSTPPPMSPIAYHSEK
jgi:hypothetical protein